MIAKRHIPNALCWLRFALVVPMLLAWAYSTQYERYAILFGCFLIASITDFFDGYLARKWQVQSVFGAMIDQITDKLVVATVLVLLVADHVIAPYAPIIIILREIYVSGLREGMAMQHIAMPVSKLGKWKTASQMLALLCLLAAPVISVTTEAASWGISLYLFGGGQLYEAQGTSWYVGLSLLGSGLLWIAALLAAISAVQYTKAALR